METIIYGLFRFSSVIQFKKGPIYCIMFFLKFFEKPLS